LYTLQTIAGLIGATLKGRHTERVVGHLLTDSRRLLFPDTTLFFALQTDRRDGADFIPELAEKGVTAFVVTGSFTIPETTEISALVFLVVADVRQALQQLATAHRAQFSLPVIGITGSNGKTIVKEWLFQLLHQHYTIVRSPRSYNSQTGVPLSIWPLAHTDTLAIFEAGISAPGEMAALEGMIRPTIGVLTNIGSAHDDGFASRHDKLVEKCLLFRHAQIVVCPYALAAGLPIPAGIPVFTWGEAAEADLQLAAMSASATEAVLTVRYRQTITTFTLPFTDEASISNVLTCLAVCCCLQQSLTGMESTVRQLQPVEMRLELKNGINDCTLINDSYSADLNSLIIALDFLQQQQQHRKRTLILSDIAGSGKPPDTLYAELAIILKQKKVDRFIGVGAAISSAAHHFSGIEETRFFTSTEALLQQWPTLHFNRETILVKGARLYAFERIIHLLCEKAHQTVLEINLSAIAHNLKTYQQWLHPGTRIMAMVKAAGYGSGSFEIARVLQFYKTDYLAVAYADEGVELRRSGIRLPIMVMNAEDATFDALVAYTLEPELYGFGIYHSLEQYLRKSGVTNFPVHLKLDTGMHRLGFEPGDIPALAALLKGNPVFKVQTVFSHLVASDNPEHDAFTLEQATRFRQAVTILQGALPYPFLCHLANTAAIHRHPDLQCDMVRLGIGLYGVDAVPAVAQQLRNVTTLKTTVSQLKKVSAGETVGYNRKGIFSRDGIVATVRIGYADGYPRGLSNGLGSMLIRGQLAPVVGTVCMDMTMLDVTDIPGVLEGDEVIVFGEALPVSTVARQANTIPYEILTGISQRVQRIYFEE
jgi:Alr-MurF fusion protein